MYTLEPDVEAQLWALCEAGASFYSRGLAFGSTGNLSLRIGEDLYVTPTGGSLRNLKPQDLARVRISDGEALNDRKASKETPFHLAAFRAAGERAQALVHLHSTYTVALSCLEDLEEASPLPVFTPYYLMRVLPMAVVAYHLPGSSELADAIGVAAVEHDAILLRNHGAVMLGGTLNEAVDKAEELEETAKLWFLLRGEKIRHLTQEEQGRILARYRR